MAETHKSVAVVLAAHGDRGGEGENKQLASHADELAKSGAYAGVFWGVLNGEPTIEEALDQADACGADQIVVYPIFMSAGYFVKTVLTERVSAAGLKTPTGIMQPLGLDKRLALLMLEHALRATKAAGIDAGEARLLVVGHGSTQGDENAEATKRAARSLSSHSPYARIETAFIDQEPFMGDALTHYDGTTVVAGFLSGDGMHGGEDVPQAIKNSRARALYTGPIGLHPRVAELIQSSLSRALAEQDEADAPEDVAPAATPRPAPKPHAAKREVQAAPSVKAEPEVVSAPVPEDPPEPVKEPKKSNAATRRARRRASPIRLLFKAVAVLAMMAVLGAVAVPFFVSEDVIREQAISLVKQKTGRTLKIGGSTSFSIFPNVGVEMEDVSISNPPGMADGETLRMDALNINLKLLPLLSRKVEVDRFVLEGPVFSLVVDAQGRKNWDFKKTAFLPELKDRQTADVRKRVAFAQAGGIGGGAVQEISLGTVSISDGTVNYADQKTGVRHNVKAINVTLEQPRLDKPLDANGDLVWKGEKIEFEGWLENIPGLLREASSGARFNFSSRLAKGSFEGAFSVAPSPAAKGVLKTESPSIRELANWLGNPIEPGGGLGPLAIKSDMSLVGETLTFSKAQLSIDGMNGTGQMAVRLKGVRPFVTASIDFDKLDLNPYMGEPGSSTRAVAPAAPVPAQPAQGPEPKSGESLTDFIKKLDKDPQGQPRTQVRAWSQEALDYSGLRAVDGDFKISTKTILLNNIKTGTGDVDANIRSGVLTADLKRLQLYSGTGTGKVTLNGARAVPGLAATFNLSGISALPLLKDAAGFEWISGRANMAINVAGNGRSQTELMRSLRGQGNYAFTNGAIEGINIPEMVRGLKQGRFDGWKRNARAKTDFSQLNATFTIQQGVALNRDLLMVGPLLRMTGEGTVDIGNERIDYSALPRIVASLEGQGAQIEQGRGIAIPVKITGAWERPKVKVDLERLMNDPELAQNAINEVGKALENKEDLNNILKGLLGGGNSQGQGGAPQGQGGAPQGQGGNPQGQAIKPEDVLKKLFGN